MKKVLKVAVPFLFLGIVLYFLMGQLSSIRMADILEGFSRIEPLIIVTAIGLVIVNYIILGSFDFMGIRSLKIRKPSFGKILLSAFICYAFTINMGALIGGLGFRYKIYPEWGVEKKSIPKIIVLSVLANWSGYVLLTGLTFLFKSSAASHLLNLPLFVCRGLGVTLMGAIGVYLFLCAKKKEIRIKRSIFTFPDLSIAILQISSSVVQWLILTSIIYLFLDQMAPGVDFISVLYTFLLTCIAGVVTHVPAGLGVIETIFIKLNAGISKVDILVALLCYRALYYLIPLLIAAPLYLGLEIYFRKKSYFHRRG